MARQTAEQVTEGIDLSGKTALVTGVNSGIGTETMRVLALRGATVIGTARSEEKAAEACAACPGDTQPLACELTDLASVRGCVEAIGTRPLDIVIANAGIMAPPSLEQVRGIEKQFATNHLGHFLLITSLLDNVQAAAEARIAIVSSAAHMRAPKAGIDFSNLSGEQGYSGWQAYGQSKLANVLFANELARRLGPSVSVNSLHPGVIRTNLGRNMKGPLMVALGLVMLPFMISVAQGAATSCYVATSPDVAGMSGQYFADCAPAKSNPLALERELAERLWAVSAELTAQSHD